MLAFQRMDIDIGCPESECISVLVWELLLQEMNKLGIKVRWVHIRAHVNAQGNEVANGFAMEGMC